MKAFILYIFFVFTISAANAQDISTINLKEVKTGQSVDLKSKISSKGAFIFFIDDTCPFVDSYMSRLQDFSQKQSGKGYAVLFINPHENNNPSTDNLAEMKKYFSAKKLGGVYFSDTDHALVKALGATKLPEVFFVKLNGNQLSIIYQGAIDNNPQNAGEVSNNYLSDAVSAHEAGKKPSTSKTPALGCRIKRF
ncbi:hypothetical protein GCM10011506_02930 [Marivirga lumbricoides]|uniref:Alkyl hydroperoxide reductase subunit C/ Thiol specific antioxidant domain-containing protein n=1 Tax=Marivirga lumbricoides TaxID=1046115 RepID=A0A2T4DMW4_9BACT|nr:hypothetical protein C9994_11515 [Marivirga lumbricoides]GGC21148.1 hypothetical protein GCM10011506_02930 [Marivirga lumbricoides]